MKIIFYKKEDGSMPAVDFLESLEPKMRVKATGVIQLLKEKGDRLREPFSKKIDDHIFELRVRHGSDIIRIMYFYSERGTVCLTNGFIKKTQKTPKNEILLANRYRSDYLGKEKA